MKNQFNIILTSLLLAGAFAAPAHADPATLSNVFIKPSVTPLMPAGYTAVANVGEEITLVINAAGGGTSTCPSLVVDKGEGAAPAYISAQLPMLNKVTYQTPGLKNIKIASVPGVENACLGSISSQIYIAAKNSFTPNSLTWGWSGGNAQTGPIVNGGKVGEKLVSQIGGTGHCDGINIDFGDGTVIKAGVGVFSPNLSLHFQPGMHAYTKAGTYNLRVWDSGATNCGELKAQAHVTAPPPALGSAIVIKPVLLTPVTTTTTTTQKTTTTTKKVTTTTLKKCPKGKPGIDCDNGL